MALDNIYRIKEIKQPTEVKPQQDLKTIRKELHDLVDSLPVSDIDQKWIRENESKENNFNVPASKPDDEQVIDDILAKFKKIRESNNNMRAEMRNQQLTPLQQLEATKNLLNSLNGGKSR